MPEKISEISPPKGWLLFLFRLPRWLYHWRLGWVLGGRMLLLKHTGRVSGQVRETVLEVVGHDRQSDTYYVVAAYGERADWYLNLLKNPKAEIQVGRRSHAVKAERLSDEGGGVLLVDYARKHPTAIKQLSRFMGYQVDGTEDDYRALGELLYVIALKPSMGEPK